MSDIAKQMGREKIKGTIIYICLAVLMSTIIGIYILDIAVKDIEIAEQGIFKIHTSEGTVSINSSNILRIEKTYTKAAITGVPVELDKIYTDKGFIYLSSLDPFAEAGQAIINSVDFHGVATWFRPNTTLHTVQPYSFAIGTPKSHIPLIFVLVFLRYLSLTIGAITLFILIAPLRRGKHDYENIDTLPQETDFSTTEEHHYGVAAK